MTKRQAKIDSNYRLMADTYSDLLSQGYSRGEATEIMARAANLSMNMITAAIKRGRELNREITFRKLDAKIGR